MSPNAARYADQSINNVEIEFVNSTTIFWEGGRSGYSESATSRFPLPSHRGMRGPHTRRTEPWFAGNFSPCTSAAPFHTCVINSLGQTVSQSDLHAGACLNLGIHRMQQPGGVSQSPKAAVVEQKVELRAWRARAGRAACDWMDKIMSTNVAGAVWTELPPSRPSVGSLVSPHPDYWHSSKLSVSTCLQFIFPFSNIQPNTPKS